MKFDSVKFVQEHPVDVAMVEILDESAVDRIAKEQGKAVRFIKSQLNYILLSNDCFLCTRCNKIHTMSERSSNHCMWCKQCNSDYQTLAYHRSKKSESIDVVKDNKQKQNKSEVGVMNELLILDILSYLRQQSKYDDTAKALFGDLLDTVKVSFIKEEN